MVSHNRNSVQSWELLHQHRGHRPHHGGGSGTDSIGLEGIRTFWGKIMGTSAASPGRNVLKETSWESLDLKGKKPERDRNRDKM